MPIYTVKVVKEDGTLATIYPCARQEAASHYLALANCLNRFGFTVKPGGLTMTERRVPQSTHKVVQVGTVNPRWGYRN